MKNYDADDNILNMDLLSSIKRSELYKLVKKVFIGSTIAGIISMIGLIVLAIINPAVLSSLAFPLALISFFPFVPGIAKSLLEREKDNYLKYCNNYNVLKGKHADIYKIELKNGNVVLMDAKSGTILNRKELKNLKEEKSDLEEQIMDLEFYLRDQRAKETHQSKAEIKKYHFLNDDEIVFNEAVGRDREIGILEETLVMKSISPLIIGPSGVGKTALIRGLVYKIKKGEVPEFLKNKKIGIIDTSTLVSGCQYVGMFEKKMKEFIEYAKREKVIFFIDEFHTLMGAGAGSKSNLDGANILKPHLLNGDIKIIGATTIDEYEQYIKSDKAFCRRFEVIKLDEPNDKVLFNIVLTHIKNYEREYNVKFSNNEIQKEAIIEVLLDITSKKHRKYDSDVMNPSLVLSIIERSFVKAKLNNKEFVGIQEICESLNSNENIYASMVDNAISELSELDSESKEGSARVLKFNPFLYK